MGQEHAGGSPGVGSWSGEQGLWRGQDLEAAEGERECAVMGDKWPPLASRAECTTQARGTSEDGGGGTAGKLPMTRVASWIPPRGRQRAAPQCTSRPRGAHGQHIPGIPFSSQTTNKFKLGSQAIKAACLSLTIHPGASQSQPPGSCTPRRISSKLSAGDSCAIANSNHRSQ
jgi:hypothetical protein